MKLPKLSPERLRHREEFVRYTRGTEDGLTPTYAVRMVCDDPECQDEIHGKEYQCMGWHEKDKEAG